MGIGRNYAICNATCEMKILVRETIVGRVWEVNSSNTTHLPSNSFKNRPRRLRENIRNKFEHFWARNFSSKSKQSPNAERCTIFYQMYCVSTSNQNTVICLRCVLACVKVLLHLSSLVHIVFICHYDYDISFSEKILVCDCWLPMLPGTTYEQAK